ncbi:MAG: hypothetical protein Q8J69_11770 [Sphingobacteriaceae bacterium]|nr:hypothetical protein [Sphingobacteriaceae bacterium]
MQKLKYILLLFAGALLLQACPARPLPPETIYSAVLMNRSTLEASVRWEAPRQVGIPGKIYYIAPYLLISEQYRGVHVLNNADPSNPTPVGFIRVPGCMDMAVNNGLLSVDNAVDLVVIDILTTPGQAIVKSRTRSVFPELVPPDQNRVPDRYKKENRPEGTIIVAWEKMEGK